MDVIEGFVIPVTKYLLGGSEKTGPKEVLIVEDDPDDLELISSGFAGHTLHVARTFQEAKLLLRELRRIDGAFIDLNIPGGQTGEKIAPGMVLYNKIRVLFPEARAAVVCGDASLLRPGDQAMIIIKWERLAKDAKDYLNSTNGNGRPHPVNHVRLFLLIMIGGTFIWLAGSFEWFEALAAKIKQLAP